MSGKLALILALPVLLFSFSAQALSALPVPAQTAAGDVTLVRGFCGLGFHRGPYGGCIRNGTVAAPPIVVSPPVVVAPRYTAPVVVSPRYAPPPVVVEEPVCPYGYYLGPYNRCLPY
jgi:hypothetical protein